MSAICSAKNTIFEGRNYLALENILLYTVVLSRFFRSRENISKISNRRREKNINENPVDGNDEPSAIISQRNGDERCRQDGNN